MTVSSLTRYLSVWMSIQTVCHWIILLSLIFGVDYTKGKGGNPIVFFSALKETRFWKISLKLSNDLIISRSLICAAAFSLKINSCKRSSNIVLIAGTGKAWLLSGASQKHLAVHCFKQDSELDGCLAYGLLC